MAEDTKEDTDILDSWEELEDSEVLNKKLEKISLSAEKSPRTTNVNMMVTEEGRRIQYQKQIKILRREAPPSTAEAQSTNSVNSKPTKSLEQREAEYAEARQRIMGSDYVSVDEEQLTDEETRIVQLMAASEFCEAVKQKAREVNSNPADGDAPKVQPREPVIRQPKGPPDSNSKGFNLER